MKRVSVLICASLVLLGFAHAEDPNTGPAPALLKAEKALRAVLADVDPEPLFEYSEHSESLIVKYRTRKFMVHRTTKIGKHSEKAIEVEGPSYQGFLLKIHLQNAGTVNQAVVPQTIRRPYWTMDLDVTLIRATDKQLYWALSYGSRVNKDLLKQIRHAIKSLDKRR